MNIADLLQERGISEADAESILEDLASGAGWGNRVDEWVLPVLPAPGGPVISPTEDTIAVLQARLNEVMRERIETERDLVLTNLRLEEAVTSVGVLRLLARIADEMGISIGWSALYFTVFLTWWGGQTPAKRLFGIRAMRLDGRGISPWTAFGRFGGYAAGLATGLLGFLQVLWDPNRQAVHDKIAGTVVVRE
jgi:hypothetical protein